MAYTIPTAAEVRAAYPEFGAVADAPIDEGLALGALVIDTTWPEAAYPLAFKLYAAHHLRLAGLGTVAGSVSEDQGGANVKRRKAGDHELEFFDTGGGTATGSAEWYALTPYGSDFLRLQRRYFGGPRWF